MPSLQHLETQKMDFKNLTEKDVELLDYQDCRPGTPGQDPLDSESLPEHVRKILERKAASEQPPERSED